jgi:hypothetical protein
VGVGKKTSKKINKHLASFTLVFCFVLVWFGLVLYFFFFFETGSHCVALGVLPMHICECNCDVIHLNLHPV